MARLTTMLTQLRQSLPSRLLLPIFAGALLLGSIVGALPFLVSHSLRLGALAERVSAFQPAHQPGCQGQACFNQDPIQEGCVADAVTQASVPIVYTGSVVHQMTPTLAVQPGEIIGRIDRRYSPSCQAYWARAFSFGSANAAEMTLSPDPNAPNEGLDTQSSSPGPVALSLYSNMTPAPESATAVVTLVDLNINEFRVSATLS
jgi:hypothetical protein